MSNFELPDDLIERMRQYPHIDWISMIRSTVEKRIQRLELANELTKESQLTEDDAIEIGRLINKSALKRYLVDET